MGKNKKKQKNQKSNRLHFNLINFKASHYYLFNVTRYRNFIENVSDFNDIKLNNEEISFIQSEIENCISKKKENEKRISIEVLPEFFRSLKLIKKYDLKNSVYANNIRTIIIFLKKNNNKITLKKIAEQYVIIFGKSISITTISRILKNHLEMKYFRTSIKNPRFEENNYLFMSFVFIRIFFRSMLMKLNIIFVDETGFLLQNNNYFSWRERDEQIYSGAKKNNKERLNLILAVTNQNVIHKKFLKSSVNSNIFLEFLEEMYNNLDEVQKQNSIVIMDNATYHLTDSIINFFKMSKIKGLTICPYRSEFNMIELVFRFIKNIIYKNIYSSINRLENEINNILDSINLKNSLINLFRETLQQYLIFIQNNNFLDLNKIMNSNKNLSK